MRGSPVGILQGSQWLCYHHKTNIAADKGEHMRKSLFSLDGIDLDDFDEISSAWDHWVLDLHRQGLRPGEHPLPESTETDLWYQLYPIGGLNDFNDEFVADTTVAAVSLGSVA